ITLAVFASGLQVALADPYIGWQNAYDGTEASTLALWNFEGVYLIYSGTWQNSDEVVNGATYKARVANFTTSNEARLQGTGKFGSSAAYNFGATTLGDDVYVQNSHIDGSLWPDGSDASLSVECWMKLDSNGISDTLQYIVDRSTTDSTGFVFFLQDNDGDGNKNLKFFIGDGSAMKLAYANTVWTVDQWYHIAGTWNADDDTVRLYRDGVLLDSTVATGSVLAEAKGAILIAQRNKSSYNGLNGAVDELRISSVAYEYAVPMPATICLLALGALALVLIGKTKTA
ncbi:MAG: LamG domain-containing protein, partial [Holophagae bacterium]|nr:LamG domain-containing protein [Holophagae bacterium]